MFRKISVLLLTCITLLTCYSGIAAPTQGPPPKFLDAKNILGLAAKSIVESVGEPNAVAIKGCGLPINAGGTDQMLEGDAWLYDYKTETRAARLILCVYKDNVVSYMRQFQELTGGVSTRGQLEQLDQELVKKLFLNLGAEENTAPDQMLKKQELSV